MNEERSHINRLIEESGLDASEYADVAEALSTLHALVPDQAPAPSGELAGLLSAGIVVPLARPRTRHSRTALTAAAAAAVVTLGTGFAAAANTLPEPAQRMLNHFSHRYLPFEFPSPDDRPDGTPGSKLKDVVGQTDNGNHVGEGSGAGKTDNLGRHNGTTGGQGNADKPGTNNGLGPDANNGDNGVKAGAGGGNAGGNGKANTGNTAAGPSDHAGGNAGDRSNNGRAPGAGRGNDNGKAPATPGGKGTSAKG